MILPYSLSSNALVTSTAIWIISAALGVPISPMLRVSYGRSWLIPNHSSFLLFANLPAAPSAVDYVLGNLARTPSLTSCVISEDHPLNTSDYVPIFTCLNMNVFKLSQPSHNTIPHLCWEHSVNDGSVMLYAFRCDDLMRPFMNKDYSSIEQLDNDISYVCKSLINTSLSTIPSMKPHHRNHMWVFDSYPTCVGVVMLPIGSGKHQVAQGSVRLYEIGKRVNVKLPPTWLNAKPVLNVSTFKNAMNNLLPKVLAASDLTPPNLKARPFLLMAPL